MTAIYKKELRSALYSVTGCLFVSVNLLVIGLYFLADNLLGMYNSLNALMSSVDFILIIMVPILTMRILSEERRLKTDQLLLTSPVSIGSIVLGKYLSMLTFFMIPTLVACALPPIMSCFGEVDYAGSYISILGYFLFGSACIAVGVFISSLTESQVIAAVLSFIILFLTFLMNGIVNILSRGGENASRILEIFDFASRLEGLMNGVVNIADVVYFLSVTVLLLFLTYQSIQRRRFSVSRATLSLSVYSSAVSFIAIGIAVALNLVVSALPTTMTSIDLTNEGRYTLTQDSKEFLASLSEDITIYVIAANEDELKDYGYSEVAATLRQYEETSPRIKVVYKDPALDPGFISNYTDSQISICSLVVVNGGRFRVINGYDLYETEVDYQTYTENRTAYDGEGQLTSAISYVTVDDMPVVYELTGHDEDPISRFTSLHDAIEKMNLQMEQINLLNTGAVPEDAAALFILGPKSDLTGEDAGLIMDYLDGGGKAVIACNYTPEDMPNLDSVMSHYGVEHINGIVVEADPQYMYQMPVYCVPKVETGTLTASIISKNLLTLLPQTSGFSISGGDAEGAAEVESQLSSSQQSYAKMNIDEESTFDFEEGDIEGPLSLAAYITSGEMKLAVFGCDTMFEDEVNARVAGANVEMVTNALNEMADRSLNISIPAKSYNAANLTVTYGTALLLGLLFVILLPGATLVGGIVLWLRRRHR